MKSRQTKKRKVTEEDIEAAKERKRKRARREALRAKRIAEGKCRYCNNKQWNGTKYCKYHRDYFMKWHRDRAALKAKAAKGELIINKKSKWITKLGTQVKRGRYKNLWADEELFFKDKTLCDVVMLTYLDVARILNCHRSTAYTILKRQKARLLNAR